MSFYLFKIKNNEINAKTKGKNMYNWTGITTYFSFNSYSAFGPSEELIVISVKINTWLRYAILIVYVLIFRICKVFIT